MPWNLMFVLRSSSAGTGWALVSPGLALSLECFRPSFCYEALHREREKGGGACDDAGEAQQPREHVRSRVVPRV